MNTTFTFYYSFMSKNAGTILFLNDFPDNSLMHLGREMIVISAHIASLENQKSRKYFFLSFWTKNRENFQIKRRNILSRIFACHILGGLS